MTRLIISLLREINPCSEEVDISAKSKCLLALRYPVTLLCRGLRLWSEHHQRMRRGAESKHNCAHVSVCRTFMPSYWWIPFGPVPAHCRLSARVGGSFYMYMRLLPCEQGTKLMSFWVVSIFLLQRLLDIISQRVLGYWPATSSTPFYLCDTLHWNMNKSMNTFLSSSTADMC